MNPEPAIINTFYEAISKNEIKKVEQLLTSGVVSVHCIIPKEKDRTALHIAAHKGKYKLVSTLVDNHNANVNVKDRDGKIPLQLATDRYHMKIVKFLLKRNSDLREYAARYLNSDQIEEFFEATARNDIDGVLRLINAGIDVDSEDRSNYNRTALEVAASSGYNDLVRILVDNEADLYHEDEIGESAYHKAVNNKHDNVANLLVERGFNEPFANSVSSNESDVSLNFLSNTDK